jgi:hypothetical protein
VPQRQRLDAGRMDVAAAADDHLLLAPGDAEIACLVDPAEVAGLVSAVMPAARRSFSSEVNVGLPKVTFRLVTRCEVRS